MAQAPRHDPQAGKMSSELCRRFGVRLREARRTAGMTQGQVAKAAFMSQVDISRIESGRRNLTIETMSRLAMVVGTTLDDLLGVCSAHDDNS